MKFKPRSTPHLRHTDQGLFLLATRAEAGADLQFPPARGALAGQALEEVPLGPEGTLYTYTTVHAGGGQAPRQLAMVDFAPGVRVCGPLLAPQQPAAFGGAVRLVPFTLADGSDDYAFETL